MLKNIVLTSAILLSSHAVSACQPERLEVKLRKQIVNFFNVHAPRNWVVELDYVECFIMTAAESFQEIELRCGLQIQFNQPSDDVQVIKFKNEIFERFGKNSSTHFTGADFALAKSHAGREIYLCK